MSSAALQHFTTRLVPREQRLTEWNKFGASQFPGLQVSSAGDAVASIKQWRLDQLLLADIHIGRAVTERQGVVRAAADEAEAIDVYVLLCGNALFSQGGRHGVLNAGDISYFTNEDAFALATSDKTRLLVVHVTNTCLNAKWDWLCEHSATVISGAAPGALVLRNFLETIWQQGPEFIAPGIGTTPMAQALLPLVSNALCTEARWHRNATESVPRTGDRILEIIQRDLLLPELGTARIASEVGVTMRAVQEFFAQRGTTPTRYITNLRLDIAAKQLELMQDELSITQLALSLGFTDSSYFSRCFKAKMGESPRQHRRRMTRLAAG